MRQLISENLPWANRTVAMLSFPRTVLSLKQSTEPTQVHRQDKGEVFEAVKRLGSEPSDILFSHGSIYVEGVHDEDLLNNGWPDRVMGYRITELGGRKEVEKEIKNLQAAEQNGNLDTPQCFIFDLDGRPTNATDTQKVKVQQWDRYCLENYLLESDTIYDVCVAEGFKNVPSRGELATMLRDTALAQLRGFIAQEVYETMEPDNPGFRPEVASKEAYTDMADALLARVLTIKDQLDNIDPSSWVQNYTHQCEVLDNKQRKQWRKKWQVLANDKRILNEVYKQLGPTCSQLEFKRHIVRKMRADKTKSWHEVDGRLESALER